MMRALVTAAALMVSGLAASAQPSPGELVACRTQFVRFFLAENSTHTTFQSLSAPGCNHAFTGDAYTVYQSINVLRRPRNMVITPNSNGFGYSLAVRGGYKGADSYTIKACGRGREGPGCVTITYEVTVY
jgi:hypothetical protein